MFDVFLDIFTYRDNALRRMDARAKLVAALATILAVILSHRIVLPLAVVVFCVGTMLALRLPPRLILLRLSVPLGVALVLLVLQSLMIGSTPLAVFHVGGWRITAMREGAALGLLIGSRVLGAVSAMLLLSSSTPAYEIFRALRWFRFPRDWVEIAMLMYRYTFALLDMADDIESAQRVRLGYSGLGRSMSSLGVLAGSIIVGSIDQAARTQDAMVLRGYRGYMPFGPMRAMRPADKWLVAAALFAVAAGYLAAEMRWV